MHFKAQVFFEISFSIKTRKNIVFFVIFPIIKRIDRARNSSVTFFIILLSLNQYVFNKTLNV